MAFDVARLLVTPGSSIRTVMECIDRNMIGLALLADVDGRLTATVTDGDIRRAILADLDLDSPIEAALERRPHEPYPTPLTRPADTRDEELLQVMNETGLRHIPLVDGAGKVVDLALLNDLVKAERLPVRAVVMAGGYGTRLQPLTEGVPKPMLPIGDRPLLERIVRRLGEAGIHHVQLTTHHQAEAIAAHFGDGARFGIDIRYTNEEEPLGTAGALALLEEAEEPILVMNGDILTAVDFSALLHFHREHRADMTVAVRPYEVRVPYGIVETSGEKVVGISEKPLLKAFVNAGIYLLEPHVRRHVPAGEASDMTHLIERLVAGGERVVSFPLREYWIDIGQPEDYEQALLDLEENKD